MSKILIFVRPAFFVFGVFKRDGKKQPLRGVNGDVNDEM